MRWYVSGVYARFGIAEGVLVVRMCGRTSMSKVCPVYVQVEVCYEKSQHVGGVSVGCSVGLLGVRADV